MIRPLYSQDSVQPGQALHANLAVPRAMSDRLRLGVSAYVLHQITDDRIDDRRVANSRERVVGIVPD